MLEKIRSYWQIARDDWRYQGIAVLLWRITVKLLSPVIKLDLQILFDLDLTQDLRAMPAKIGCEITRAVEADIGEIIDMTMVGEWPQPGTVLDDAQELQLALLQRAHATACEAYRLQMRAGEHCYIARVDGILAHSNWVRFHDCAPYGTKDVTLKPGEIYTTDGFTRVMFRGQRVHEAVATHMLLVAKQRGCQRALTITDLFKGGARRGVHRIGWNWLGTILYVTPRGLKRSWLVRLGGDLSPILDNAQQSMASAG